jgi:multidrug resistance efflux pump
VGVSITYVLVRIELRSAEKRERQLTRHVATAGAEIRRLEQRLASLLDLEAQVPALKAKLQRTQAMRSKLEGQAVGQERDHQAQRQAA